jgi:hypothetical protein
MSRPFPTEGLCQAALLTLRPANFGLVDDFSALIKSYGVTKIHLQIGGGPYNLQT